VTAPSEIVPSGIATRFMEGCVTVLHGKLSGLLISVRCRASGTVFSSLVNVWKPVVFCFPVGSLTSPLPAQQTVLVSSSYTGQWCMDKNFGNCFIF